MSENISPKRIQFPNEWGIQAVDDLKTDLEPFCNIPCSIGRSSTRGDTVKKTVEPEKSPEEETDENESSKSVNVSGNAKTEEPEKHEEKSTEDEIHEDESSKPVKVNEKARTVKPENSLVIYKSSKSTQVEEKDEKLWKKVGSFALGTAVISGVVLGGTALLLPALGFGALGPIAGSCAAAYQSAVLGGKIASGSMFAKLQRVGMVGLSPEVKTGVVVGSAVASAAIIKLKKKEEMN